MGKGIALRFKSIYPDMFNEYRDYCERGQFDIGNLFLYKTPHKWILNFPTKKHWRNPSRIEYIEAGLSKFTKSYAEMGITSIAFPALGCGNGELDFETEVKPVMENHLGRITLPTFVYPALTKQQVPEHRDIRRINSWLRSEPTVLPFDEVWRDILDVLSTQHTFKTLAKGYRYTVRALPDPPQLIITSSGKGYRIDRDGLLPFWQQLRDYGFTYRNIVPEHHRISYLTPVFEKLPYVRRVDLSATVNGLKTNPRTGLQIVPHEHRVQWQNQAMSFEAVNAT